MKSPKFLIALLLTIFYEIAFPQAYRIKFIENGESFTIARNEDSRVCKTSSRYAAARISSDENFILFKLYQPREAVSGFVEIENAYSKCSPTSPLKLRYVPNYEMVIDINKKSEIYLTFKEDIYPIGGNATQVLINAAVRRLKNSQEVIYPFSILPSDSENASLKKSFLNPQTQKLIEEDYSKAKYFFISFNGEYLAPEGIDCNQYTNKSNLIFSTVTRKRILKSEKWLSTDAGVEECRQMFTGKN